MNAEIAYALNTFSAATQRLREAVDTAQSQLEKDGTIQRFEFTFELLWKTIKRLLKHQGIEVNTPRSSLEEAFRIGWLGDEATFLAMLTDRNRTSHIYNQAVSEDIFTRIRDNYVAAFEKVSATMKNRTRTGVV